MVITTGQEENKLCEKFNSRAWRLVLFAAVIWNVIQKSKLITSLIITTACTNLQHVCQYVCVWDTAQKINYKYVYSSTSVGFSGPSVVSPPESLAASLSQARGFIPSTTCQHSYQAIRLKVKLSTWDGINRRYHPLHERPKINICFVFFLKRIFPPSLVSFFSLLFCGHCSP